MQPVPLTLPTGKKNKKRKAMAEVPQQQQPSQQQQPDNLLYVSNFWNSVFECIDKQQQKK